jgi:hypothetical protein
VSRVLTARVELPEAGDLLRGIGNKKLSSTKRARRDEKADIDPLSELAH